VREGAKLELARAEWHKSSFSGASGCIEVAFVQGNVAIRDSKNQQGPVLVFSPNEWTAFLSGVRGGEFELPS
jgi:Domain of unknown function (DUF397)